MPPSLPVPRLGALTLYLGGGAGGVGESIVIHMPDGRWIVMDVCYCADQRGGPPWNFPLHILREAGASHLDLLVLSHPDSDHFEGLEELLAAYPDRQRLRRLWTFPRNGLLELLTRWAAQLPDPWSQARRALFASLSHARHRYPMEEPCYPSSLYPPPELGPSPYSVRALVPTEEDTHRLWAEVAQISQALHGRPNSQLRAFLRDRKPTLDGNALSLGLIIEWGALKLLLAGDVEVPAGGRGGWPGLLRELEQQGEPGLLDDVDVVKVPHHGSLSRSSTSLHHETWERLRGQRARVPLALLTPKNGGNAPPPQAAGLEWLAPRADCLGVTAAPRPSTTGWSLVLNHGWAAVCAPQHASHLGSWLAVELAADGTYRHVTGSLARWFAPRL